MQKFLENASNISGIFGILLCLFAGIFRVIGGFHVAGFELLTMYNVGMGIMIFSGLLKLEVLLDEIRRSDQRR